MGSYAAFALVLVVLAIGCVDEEPTAVVARQTDEVDGIRMEAEASRQRGDLTVAVTLTNAGDTPIRVDGDLVFLLSVTVWNARGGYIEFEAGEAFPELPRGAVNTRLTMIEPGQTLRRELALATGFRELATARVLYARASGRTEYTSAYETLVRLPRGAVPAGVDVDYLPALGIYQDGIATYTGTRYEDLGLFEGPLSVSIPISRPAPGGAEIGMALLLIYWAIGLAILAMAGGANTNRRFFVGSLAAFLAAATAVAWVKVIWPGVIAARLTEPLHFSVGRTFGGVLLIGLLIWVLLHFLRWGALVLLLPLLLALAGRAATAQRIRSQTPRRLGDALRLVQRGGGTANM